MCTVYAKYFANIVNKYLYCSSYIVILLCGIYWELLTATGWDSRPGNIGECLVHKTQQKLRVHKYFCGLIDLKWPPDFKYFAGKCSENPIFTTNPRTQTNPNCFLVSDVPLRWRITYEKHTPPPCNNLK